MNIEQQKKQLIQTKKEITEELNGLGRKISDNGDWIALPDQGDGTTADTVDNADITEDYEEKIAVLKILEERYHTVDRALEAIEDGTYGICKKCKENIDEKRLEANPSATTCINHNA